MPCYDPMPNLVDDKIATELNKVNAVLDEINNHPGKITKLFYKKEMAMRQSDNLREQLKTKTQELCTKLQRYNIQLLSSEAKFWWTKHRLDDKSNLARFLKQKCNEFKKINKEYTHSSYRTLIYDVMKLPYIVNLSLDSYDTQLLAEMLVDGFWFDENIYEL